MIEVMFAPDIESLPASSRKLVESNPDIIITISSPAPVALKRFTQTIPIVITTSENPISLGLVDSLSKPGGNITGNFNLNTELLRKLVGITKEIIPGVRRIGLIAFVDDPKTPADIKVAAEAAHENSVELEIFAYHSGTEFKSIFELAKHKYCDAILLTGSAYFNGRAKEIAKEGLDLHIPVFYGARYLPDAGGLISYGANPVELAKRSAYFVNRILKGSKPGDLPIEQPSQFEFVVNLRTARLLGISINDAIIAKATDIIE